MWVHTIGWGGLNPHFLDYGYSVLPTFYSYCSPDWLVLKSRRSFGGLSNCLVLVWCIDGDAERYFHGVKNDVKWFVIIRSPITRIYYYQIYMDSLTKCKRNEQQ